MFQIILIGDLDITYRNCQFATLISYTTLQGAAYGRGKAFVDTKLDTSAYQVGCRAATITAPQLAERILSVQQKLFYDHLCHPVGQTLTPNKFCIVVFGATGRNFPRNVMRYGRSP